MNKVYAATLVEDPENLDEMILQFPPDLMKETGWVEGDTLIWEENKNGTFTIKKKE